MSTIQTEIANTVDTIADDVARWASSKRADEYMIRKVPIHLVLVPLTRRLGGEYVVVGTETAVVVKRRATAVTHADVH